MISLLFCMVSVLKFRICIFIAYILSLIFNASGYHVLFWEFMSLYISRDRAVTVWLTLGPARLSTVLVTRTSNKQCFSKYILAYLKDIILLKTIFWGYKSLLKTFRIGKFLNNLHIKNCHLRLRYFTNWLYFQNVAEELGDI
jgi:hypothetical protein